MMVNYSHVVSEDDRQLAAELGRMLAPKSNAILEHLAPASNLVLERFGATNENDLNAVCV